MLKSFLTYGVIPLWLFVLPSSAFSAQAESDWPQFRGEKVDGVSTERGVFLSGQTPALVPSWKNPLGSGYSGVSIAGNLAATMDTDGVSNILVALDATTGRERWRFPLSSIYKGHDGSYDGPISTPLIHADRVVALGPGGRLVAVGGSDGELAWSVDLVADLGARAPYYGFASSPLQIAGTVVVQVGSQGGTVAAFDSETGELRWRAGDDSVSYQTPIPMVVDGRSQLVASGDKRLFGIDGASGQVLWDYAHGGSGAVGSWSMVPVAAGERLILNIKDHASAGVRLHGIGDAGSLQTLWESRTIRNTYAVAVHHQGYLYAFSSRFLTCVDAATGEAVWKSRAPGDGFLIIVDGHLVLVTKDGSVHVAKASPLGYEELSGRQIFDEIVWTPPSFADGSLFVRSLGSIARVEVEPTSSTRMTEDASVKVGQALHSGFERFLVKVRESQDKSPVIDAFLEEQDSFPIVEDEHEVHFVYRGDADDMAIGGDMIGGRQEKAMSRVDGTDFFYFSTKLRRDARVSYVFIKDYEETLTDPLNPTVAHWALIGEDMNVDPAGGNGQEPMAVSSLAMPGWEAPAHLRPLPVGAPRGRLVRRELESAAMGRRHAFDVYLPSGYHESDGRYPVIYYHGGTNALRLGELKNSLDALIGTRLEPVIVVFVDITGGHIFMPKDRYGAMWANELVPFIDANFRTLPTSESRANVSAGTSSHEAAYCAFRYPALSSKLALQSLGVIDVGRTELESLVTSAQERPLEVHIEWGAYDLYNPHEVMDMAAETRRFVKLLTSRGYTVDAVEVADGTGWPAWRNRTDAVLGSLFPLKGRD